MRILITGGAGFQGSHLAERWSGSGHGVTILNTYSEEAARNIRAVSADSEVVWGSVTDNEIVEKTVRGHDVVVHLAARVNVDESLAEPRAFADVNLDGTINVLEAARRWGSRVVFGSSCEVYGASDGLPVPETAPLRPYSPYSASKAAADRMCYAYHMSYGLDVTIVRPSNVYGERQKSGRGGAVIPIFSSLAAAGKPLTVFGTGAQTREYIHVSDLVAAYDMIVGRGDLAGATVKRRHRGHRVGPQHRRVHRGAGGRRHIRAAGPPRRGTAVLTRQHLGPQPRVRAAGQVLGRPRPLPRLLAASADLDRHANLGTTVAGPVDIKEGEELLMHLEDAVHDSTKAEDAALARAIAEGLETESVSRKSVMEALQGDRDEA